MEVGAIKQAFNNEVILLKKSLNQAKIQIIHKLTRKAKTLTEKKAPEKIKAKYNKKAESAVKEVLIIKKIKPRDVARFIVTHKGQLNEYINRPAVDQDKACARLLLHKSMQDKYKLIRERFSNISIKDLLMSRQERRKLKNEAREKQKNKNKGKQLNEPVQTEGDWSVEDINMNDSDLTDGKTDDLQSSNDEHEDDDSNDDSVNDDEESYDEPGSVNEKGSDGDDFKPNDEHLRKKCDYKFGNSKESIESDNEVKSNDEFNDVNESGDGNFVKFTPSIPDDDIKPSNNNEISKVTKKIVAASKKKVAHSHKDTHKNRNLNRKILTKKFNKETPEIIQHRNKVVDPFFITATGENYMTLAEPRQPDEIKEVHRQGNRQYRRAVMFGHVPKMKARKNDFRPANENYSKGFDKSFKSNGFEKNNSQERYNKSKDFSKRDNFKDNRNNSKSNVEESKPEKLHPSWEAKKRQSGILPFQGKKIVFNED